LEKKILGFRNFQKMLENEISWTKGRIREFSSFTLEATELGPYAAQLYKYLFLSFWLVWKAAAA
jgi:hypothetical protein